MRCTSTEKIRRATGLIAVCLPVLAFFILWRSGVFLPRWIRWEEREIVPKESAYPVSTWYLQQGRYVLPADEADAPDRIYLSGGVLTIWQDGRIAWKSPDDVRVQDVCFDDIDHDGAGELIVLCWKRGHFGRYRPSWVTRDTTAWVQHVYLYDWTGDGVRELFLASELDLLADRMSTDDRSALRLTDADGTESVWDWSGFGLKRVPEREHTSVTFLAAGDNLIHETLLRQGLIRGDFSFLYEDVRGMVQSADLASVGLETILVDDPSAYAGYPRFGSPLSVGEALADAGFDIAACATNHALDRGSYGIDTTVSFFRQVHAARRKDKTPEDAGLFVTLGIHATDDGTDTAVHLIKKNGITFALLNYTYGVNGRPDADDTQHLAGVDLLSDPDALRSDLRRARAEAEIVVVFVHWGTEYQTEPDDTQRAWAEILLSEGVDVVIGTHPHVVQPFEVMEDADGHRMLIWYSLGDFVSGQTDVTRSNGCFASFTVSKDAGDVRITSYETK